MKESNVKCPLNEEKGEEIVITGISGVFPKSQNVYEFQDNLFKKVNMVQQNKRWNFEHAEIPSRVGAILEIDKYDPGYFGVHERQAHSLDAQYRILQEKAVEAIFDAGLHPSDLENTRTGVFVGISTCESIKPWLHPSTAQSYALTGFPFSMVANRLSYFLKLKGPSCTLDTACSTSLHAVDHAFRAIRAGEIDNAIVGATNLCLSPFQTLSLARLGVLGKDGCCKTFDNSANGYVRAEAIAVLVLQKSKDAKRVYAQVVHAKTNCNGYTEQGLGFPDREGHKVLYRDFYDECNVDRCSLTFLEAHGTGTVVGDPEECGGIDDVLAKDRTTPLLIGSLKTNCGHTEPASGLCGIIKCIIGMENGVIPPNLHFTTPRAEINGLMEGRLKVVAEATPLKEDSRALMVINNFGLGGANGHVLLGRNLKKKTNYGLPKDDLERLVCVSGRTEEAVFSLLDEVSVNTLDAEHIKLLHDVFRKNVQNHLYRGYIVLSKSGEISRSLKYCPQNSKPLYYAFGELHNWWEIGNDLMELPIFADSIRKIEEHIPSNGTNISNILRSTRPDQNFSPVIGSLAVQIGIINILNLLEIKATSSVGYSHGVLLSAYYEGVINLKETIKCAFILEEFVKKTNYLSNCKNKQQSWAATAAVANDVGSGLYKRGLQRENLKESLNASKSAATEEHSLNSLIAALEKFKPYSSSELNNKRKSANYIANAIISSCFQNTECIKRDSVILTIGDGPFRDCVESCTFSFPNSEDSENYIEEFLGTLGRLYENGYNPQISKLYPPVDFPVSRGTRMISPYIKWNHNRNFFVPDYNNDEKIKALRGDRVITVQLSDDRWSFIAGHVIDGRNLFPATGYLCLVWETYKIMNEADAEKRIVLEDCKFLRATIVPKEEFVKFNITIQKGSGTFEVVEGQSTIVTGRIYAVDDEDEEMDAYQSADLSNNESTYLPLTTKDIYKEFRLRGYYYRGALCAVQECNNQGTKAFIRWDNNWVTFLDNMLHLKILEIDSRLLYVPIYVAKISINAKRHLEWINNEYINVGKAPILPTTNDQQTGTFRCGGIHISGLIVSPIPRKKDLSITVLESYRFVPNVLVLDIQQSIKVNTQIIIENNFVSQVKVVEVVDDFTKKDAVLLTPIVQSVFEEQPLVQVYTKVLSQTPLDVTVDVEDKNLSSETDCHLVIASNVLERPQALEEAYSSLKEGGFIMSRESKEYDVRSNVQPDIIIFTIHKTPTETLILFRKQTEIKQPHYIKVNSDNFSWISKVKRAIKNNTDQDIIIYSINEPECGILGLIKSLRREPESKNIRCLFLMDETKEADIKFYEPQLKKNMAINVLKDGKWGTYRHMILGKTDLVESEHCFVNVTDRGNLSSLRWTEGPLRHNMTTPSEKELIYVYYAALNFVDIMTASGKVFIDFKDGVRQECTPGCEFSGRDTRGNRVCGVISQGALSSLVLADSYLIFKIPDSWTLEEAATVPVVYMTVIYCIIVRGQLKRGETILIHAGSGGVGQAAIRLALHYGCTVYTTVGSQAKRDFLKKMYPQLRDNQIGNSRDESFEQMIYKETNGRGVDMVLNSLAEDKLIASVRCLAKGGRFIEIGKYDLANNKSLSLLLFEKGASFHGGMVEQLLNQTPHVKKEVKEIMLNGIKCGAVKPINSKIFKFNEVGEAFKFMAAGKHIGKNLIKIRNSEDEPSVQKFPANPRYFCEPEKTYIIIGGLGGMGLELADWLVLRGARKLVLTTRKGISTGYQEYRIRVWRSYGTIVKISKAIITTRAGCLELIEESLKLGPIDAIFNLGLVLCDSIFENQTPQSFITSFEPKVFATEYLDELTRFMCPDLSEFVVFSSATSSRGFPGQTNYGMANSAMERICEQRKQDGYPALAIQWGTVGEVGAVMDIYGEYTEVTINGYSKQHIFNCLQVLDTLLKQKESTIVSSMVVAKKRAVSLAENIVDSVTTVLGISDAKSVSLHSTLAELGLDSMTSVEIRQILEREYSIYLTLKELRTTTLASLKDMSEKKQGVRQAVQEIEFQQFFKLVGNEAESRLPYMRLKSKADEESAAPKILLFPGLEGFAKIYESLASHLNAHTVCVQLRYDAEEQTIIEMAKSLIPLVKEHLEKAEPFEIVAFSYGALVALEIVHVLESQGYTGTVTCIDGAPLLYTKVVKTLNVQSEQTFETTLMGYFLSYYVPLEVAAKQTNNLLKCKSWEERVNLGLEITKEHPVFQRDYQRLVWNVLYSRIKSMVNYNPSYSKLKSTIQLYKPKNVIIRGLPEDYNLSFLSEKPVKVQVFDCDHNTILENKELATTLNSYINKGNVDE